MQLYESTVIYPNPFIALTQTMSSLFINSLNQTRGESRGAVEPERGPNFPTNE